MKLATYTTRNLALPLLLIMAVWACAFYFLILHEVNDETNDSLRNYKEILIKKALSDSTYLQDRNDIMTRYTIREIPASQARLSVDEIFDSTQYIEMEWEDEPIRVLRTHFRTSDDKYYELTLSISTLEKEDLMEKVLWSILALYVILLGCILSVTHNVFRKSLRPLHNLLDWVNRYHPARPQPPLEIETTVDEFNTLNKASMEAAQRSVRIYEQQKQFVENASHELQTPLAVCMNKLELLSEHPGCTEEQLDEIDSLHRTLQSIIRMNRSLLLLSRIENRQYPETMDVSITHKVEQILVEFSEIYEEKGIQIHRLHTEELHYPMNDELASILLRNLIKNAFVHNIPQGDIYIDITRYSLHIENTGDRGELNREKLFHRFGRQSNRPDATGLGLAVVKTIASLYDIDITYAYTGRHCFTLTFGRSVPSSSTSR